MSEEDLNEDQDQDQAIEPVEAQDPQPESESSQQAPPESPQAALEAALQQVEQYKDEALRAHAEAENVRKRTLREIEHAHKFALERFAGALLPVVDSLEKTLESVRGKHTEIKPETIVEGVELSLKLFGEALGKAGIEEVNPLGEPFNPAFHEAMSMLEAAAAEPGSVIEVLQKGYILNGRLLRAAMVIVAKAAED